MRIGTLNPGIPQLSWPPALNSPFRSGDVFSNDSTPVIEGNSAMIVIGPEMRGCNRKGILLNPSEGPVSADTTDTVGCERGENTV